MSRHNVKFFLIGYPHRKRSDLSMKIKDFEANEFTMMYVGRKIAEDAELRNEYLSIFDVIDAIYFNNESLVVKGVPRKGLYDKRMFPSGLPNGYYGCEIDAYFEPYKMFMERFNLKKIYEAKGSTFHYCITNGNPNEVFSYQRWFIVDTSRLKFDEIPEIDFTLNGFRLAFDKIDEDFKIDKFDGASDRYVVAKKMDAIFDFVVNKSGFASKSKVHDFNIQMNRMVDDIFSKSKLDNPCVVVPFDDVSRGDLSKLVEWDYECNPNQLENSDKPYSQTYAAIFKGDIPSDLPPQVSHRLKFNGKNAQSASLALSNGFKRILFNQFGSDLGIDVSVELITVHDLIKHKMNH
jgi:hypothetical protein